MIVYRFAHAKYSNDLSGTGARLKGGRWNVPGVAALYTSWSASLALLDVLANSLTLEWLQQLKLIKIYIPDGASMHELKQPDLRTEWYKDFEYTQWLGSEIIRSKNPLIIKCPSAIMNIEFNYIINPAHESFKKIKAETVKDFIFDVRLFKA